MFRAWNLYKGEGFRVIAIFEFYPRIPRHLGRGGVSRAVYKPCRAFGHSPLGRGKRGRKSHLKVHRQGLSAYEMAGEKVRLQDKNNKKVRPWVLPCALQIAERAHFGTCALFGADTDLEPFYLDWRGSTVTKI